MHIQIIDYPFEPYQLVQTYQQTLACGGQFGATCVFVGTMRDFNQGDAVQAMSLEHYPEMTEKYLAKIIAQAQLQWAVQDCLLVHRVGEINPQDAIVLVAIWSAHRGDAFDACRFMMEELKKSAPFWKKERLINNESRWVEHNSDGYAKGV
ncbi:MAG: molybdenum cofactor biosynthesis protein MoaE [Methylococcaceae bacterium]